MILGKNRARKLEAEQVLRDLVIQYKRVFGTEEGKAVLMDLMNRFHILNTHSGDALKEGQRSVVLHILSQTSVNLAALDQMLKGESGE